MSTHKAIAHRLMMQATFHFNIYIINCFFSFYLCAYMCWHWARIYFSSLKKIKNRNNSSQRSSLSVQNSHGHLWRFPKKKEKKKSENPRLWLPITVYPKHERGEKNNTKTQTNLCDIISTPDRIAWSMTTRQYEKRGEVRRKNHVGSRLCHSGRV